MPVEEVLPRNMYHDEWNGAVGAELTGTDLYDNSWYEPYPHGWDYTFRWCQISELTSRRDLFLLPIMEDISPRTFAWACPYLRRAYADQENVKRWSDYYNG